MAPSKRFRKGELLAQVVTKDLEPCAFCLRIVDDEIVYGKLYAIGDIQCHYFCALLSCCLVQKGKDSQGLFGFLYPDILAEIERSKKHKCSYCSRGGASLGCSVSQCRKQFHLPCGREKMAVSLFYGNYKSFCQQHAPKQKLPDNIMANAKLRLTKDKRALKGLAPIQKVTGNVDIDISSEESICVICYESVQGYPTNVTFWPPCCARDAWFHRACLQRMALSAGMHYLKCPLCNDKENFYNAVLTQGYYVPDRDAAWELEQNAFAEIYERPVTCSAERCVCPEGRSHDTDGGPWDIKLCMLCGMIGAHTHCISEKNRKQDPNNPTNKEQDSTISTNQNLEPDISTNQNRDVHFTNETKDNVEKLNLNQLTPKKVCTVDRYVCDSCAPAAPEDLEQLANSIQKVIIAEQSQNLERRLVMPTRMSLRRTKQRSLMPLPSTSAQNTAAPCEDNQRTDTPLTRRDLNLKTPKRLPSGPVPLVTESPLVSPLKLLQRGLAEKARECDVPIDCGLLDALRARLVKPRPLCEKKRIVNCILDNVFDDLLKQRKQKEAVKKWRSPKKSVDPLPHCTEATLKDPANDDKENISIPPTTPSKFRIIDEDTQDFNIVSIQEDTIDSPVLNQPMSKDDEDTRSTFELPKEFIADNHSDESLVETPKKLKTVDIQKDSSLEISADDIVNIDMVKMENAENTEFIKQFNLKSPVKTNCVLKFSPSDKGTLKSNNIGIDVESFKNHYLSEVGREFKRKLNNDLEKNDCKKESELSTGINIPTDASIQKEIAENGRKRKMEIKKKCSKKRKLTKNNARRKKSVLEVEIDERNSKKGAKKNIKTKFSIRNKNVRLKIKWKEEQVDLKITKSRLKKKNKPKKLKQFILQYSKDSNSETLVKPEFDVTPLKKKKCVKQEKTPDNLKQTSIHSFFKVHTPNA